MVNLLNYGEQEEIREWCEDDILFVCHGPSREGCAEGIWEELAGDDEKHQHLIGYANHMSETKGNTTARTDGKCAYYLNGITVGADGDVKACPASTHTTGMIGNARTSSLEELYDKVQSILREIVGISLPPCLVRDPSYDKLKLYSHHYG